MGPCGLIIPPHLVWREVCFLLGPAKLANEASPELFLLLRRRSRFEASSVVLDPGPKLQVATSAPLIVLPAIS